MFIARIIDKLFAALSKTETPSQAERINSFPDRILDTTSSELRDALKVMGAKLSPNPHRLTARWSSEIIQDAAALGILGHSAEQELAHAIQTECIAETFSSFFDTVRAFSFDTDVTLLDEKDHRNVINILDEIIKVATDGKPEAIVVSPTTLSLLQFRHDSETHDQPSKFTTAFDTGEQDLKVGMLGMGGYIGSVPVLVNPYAPDNYPILMLYSKWIVVEDRPDMLTETLTSDGCDTYMIDFKPQVRFNPKRTRRIKIDPTKINFF